jgi:hypothetical protein
MHVMKSDPFTELETDEVEDAFELEDEQPSKSPSRGVRTVLHSGIQGLPRISFLLTSRYTSAQIDAAVLAIAEASLSQPQRSKEVLHEESVHQ